VTMIERWPRKYLRRLAIIGIAAVLLLVVWYVGILLVCGIWEMYAWAFGATNPHTWADRFNLGPDFGYPHWAQIDPVRVLLLILPTWALLDGAFCLTITATKKALR